MKENPIHEAAIAVVEESPEAEQALLKALLWIREFGHVED